MRPKIATRRYWVASSITAHLHLIFFSISFCLLPLLSNCKFCISHDVRRK